MNFEALPKIAFDGLNGDVHQYIESDDAIKSTAGNKYLSNLFLMSFVVSHCVSLNETDTRYAY